MPTDKTVYTLGTDRRSEEDFIEILLSLDIKCLIDVRSYPTSKLEQFKKENMEALLKENGIEYRWLGPELGGYRKGGYEAYTQTEDFGKGIVLAEDTASAKKTVIVCAERFPWKCHRRFIARELHRRGWRVEHIIDKGKIWVPKG